MNNRSDRPKEKHPSFLPELSLSVALKSFSVSGEQFSCFFFGWPFAFTSWLEWLIAYLYYTMCDRAYCVDSLCMYSVSERSAQSFYLALRTIFSLIPRGKINSMIICCPKKIQNSKAPNNWTALQLQNCWFWKEIQFIWIVLYATEREEERESARDCVCVFIEWRIIIKIMNNNKNQDE